MTRAYLVVGTMLVFLALAGATIKRLPLTTAVLYLAFGWTLGAFGWIALDPRGHSVLLEHLTEIAVIVSLFSAGLKLRSPLSSKRWRLPIALASVSMAATVGMIAIVAMYWFDLPIGAAIILAGVLAPTDPVLASDVQVEHARDADRLRFTLTAEAGLNDGTAFPFVMLGLGLLGLQNLGGAVAWRWWTVDVLWAVVGGLLIGALLGIAVGRLVIYLRRVHREAVGLDDFLALGLIALSYGLALVAHAYGFLAVFAAGLALRTVERELSPEDVPKDVRAASDASVKELASDPKHAPAYMAEAVLTFNEQVERIAELAVVVVVGAMLAQLDVPLEAVGFAVLLFCVIRPVAVAPLARLYGMSRVQAALAAWFGIRGIGSVYYLFFAVNQGLPAELADRMVSITLCVVAFSICAHGFSVTPLMRLYSKR